MIKKTKNILTIISLSSLVSSVFFGIGTYLSISNQRVSGEDFGLNNYTQIDDQKVLLDKKIQDVKKPTDFYRLDANVYFEKNNIKSSKSSYSDYLEKNFNEVFSNISTVSNNVTIANFENDIYTFLKNVHIQTGNKLGIKLLTDFIQYNNNANLISFKIKAIFFNPTGQDIFFEINDFNFKLKAHEQTEVLFTANNQKIDFKLLQLHNNFFLGWKTNIAFNIFKKDYIFNDFSFTNNYSFVFPFSIDGIDARNNYFDVKDDKSNYKNITAEFVKKEIEENIKNNTSEVFELMSYLNPLVKGIASNPTIKQFLQQYAQDILNLTYRLKIFPSEFNDLLLLFLYDEEPLIKIISDNKKEISNLIAYLINDNSIKAEAIETFFDNINYESSQEEIYKQIEGLKEFVKYFFEENPTIDIDIEFVYAILDKMADKQTSSLDLLNYILNEKKEDLVNLISNFGILKSTVRLILNMATILFSNDGNNRILNAICQEESRSFLFDLINSMISIVNPVQENRPSSLFYDLTLQIISPNNINLNPFNLQNLFYDVILKMVNYFSDPNNYQIFNKFKSFDFNNNFVSYQYFSTLQFQSKISLSFETIIDILPPSIKVNDVSLPSKVLKNVLTQNGKVLEMQIFEGDQIDFQFYAKNEELIFDPIRMFNTHYVNFSLPYNMTMTINMPKMLNSITTFYHTGPFNVSNNAIFATLIQFLENLVVRDYEFKGHLTITDYSQKITNYSEDVIVNSNYFKWKKIDNLFTHKIKQNIELIDSNKVMVNQINQGFMGQEIKQISLTGKKPIFKNQNIIDEIIDHTFEYKSDIKPTIWIDPTVLTNLNIKFMGLDFGNLEINSLKIDVWFPYKVLDLTNPDKPKFSSHFTVEINL